MAADLDLVRKLVGGDHGLAVVAVSRRDGRVHTSVVNAGVLDHPVTGEPRVGFVAAGGARKLDHMRQAGRAAVVLRAGWQWASVEGPVQLAGPDDPLEGLDPSELPDLLRAIFRAAGGSHDDWEEYDRVMAAERRTAVLVTPLHVSGVGR